MASKTQEPRTSLDGEPQAPRPDFSIDVPPDDHDLRPPLMADLVAGEMIVDAVGRASPRFDPFEPGIIVIVLAPSAEWSELLSDAYTNMHVCEPGAQNPRSRLHVLERHVAPC